MRVLIIGSKRLCLRMLEHLLAIDARAIVGLVTFDDAMDTRSELSALRALGQRRGLPVHVADNRRHAEAIVGEIAPDLCLVLNWYWLIGAETLARVPRGFLGVHYSPLPRYRGTSPVVWQMINGEADVWYSVFTLGAGMDEGDLWAQDRVVLGPDDRIGEVLQRLEDAVLRTFDSLYPALLAGTARATPQPDVPATYCAARQPDDGGIDFTQSAQRCHDFIRAQAQPYPGAFTMLGDERLTIWRARPSTVTYYGRPGQVAQVAPDGVTVICGDNRPLVLLDVGWRGEIVSAASVIRSIKVRLPATAP